MRRIVRIGADGAAQVVLANIPRPNGLAFSPDERHLYVAVTRANAVWRMNVSPDGVMSRVSVFVQLSGGGGPDGIAVDEAGNVAVAHPGLGTVWLVSPDGEPIRRIRSCTRGRLTTNIAYGGPKRRTLFATESQSGAILTATMPFAGTPLYSHS